MGDIFYIYFNFYVGHYYWWLQHLIFPSCSATFISITINHISLLENMKGCNLNFPKRFSRKKSNPRHYITISMYTQISPCQLVDIFNTSRSDSQSHSPHKHRSERLWKLPTKTWWDDCEQWSTGFNVLNFTPSAVESAGRDGGSAPSLPESNVNILGSRIVGGHRNDIMIWYIRDHPKHNKTQGRLQRRLTMGSRVGLPTVQ